MGWFCVDFKQIDVSMTAISAYKTENKVNLEHIESIIVVVASFIKHISRSLKYKK